jgi:hypothetical protein
MTSWTHATRHLQIDNYLLPLLLFGRPHSSDDMCGSRLQSIVEGILILCASLHHDHVCRDQANNALHSMCRVRLPARTGLY